MNERKRTVKDEMDSILVQMDAVRGIDDKQYKMLAEQYTALSHARNEGRIKPDTIFSGILNLAGIGIVMNFERLHVIATKAWPMVAKLKFL